MSEKQQGGGRRPPDDLPGWVRFWVPPSRRPTPAFAVLAVALAAAWLPVLLGRGPWEGYDPRWGAGLGSLLALWILLAVAWMYLRGKWR